MNEPSGFKIAFDTAKRISQNQESTTWHSSYYRYRPFHVEYIKIELSRNPISTLWLGAVAAEYTTQEGGKKETYHDTNGHSSLEVIEKLEEHIKEWLGKEVYGAGNEGRE